MTWWPGEKALRTGVRSESGEGIQEIQEPPEHSGRFLSGWEVFSSSGVCVLSFFPLPCLFLSHPPSISSQLSLLLLWDCSSVWTDLLHMAENMVGSNSGIIIFQPKPGVLFTILGERLLNLHACIGRITKVRRVLSQGLTPVFRVAEIVARIARSTNIRWAGHHSDLGTGKVYHASI